MGKHEREQIKKAELIIVKILNNKEFSKSDFKNHWFKHACTIAEAIKADFSDILSAKHLGDDYITIGDISFTSKGHEIIVEIKMSDTEFGLGTKANISQNALTDNKLFEGNVYSWSKYRDEKRHDLWVMEFLNKFKKYPTIISDIKNIQNNKEEKARYLRKLKRKDKVAKKILDDIRDKDRKEKEEYLLYLSKRKQTPDMIRRFLGLIILGIHRKEEMSALIESDKFMDEAKRLVVYYGNLSNGKIIVNKQNVGDALKKILNRFIQFKINFIPSITHCKLVGVEKSGNEVPLLQIVIHWKNISQGIKTPCLNIFDLYSGII